MRDWHFELLRLVSMLLIVATHFFCSRQLACPYGFRFNADMGRFYTDCLIHDRAGRRRAIYVNFRLFPRIQHV